ncbi:hypothetical protein DYQ86_05155 [Acidobacteria bacterium AB60]|nr:hypothetical protein DYQ86_05155 [Acidobacteria bacterium AB60]
MATDGTSATTELDPVFSQLAEPFAPCEIKWRVTHTNKDGSRGAVIAFADPRAYTDRLNQLFTPTGWTRTYEISTVSSVTRIKKDKLIQTGKVLVTCMLTITGLGCHSGSGEEWADEENAMTSAEAQAFKRAASCFGLGRYLYNFTEMWVPLNEHRQPTQFPTLPQWALPKAQRNGKAHPASGPRPSAIQRGPIDQKTTARIEGFRRILGDAIYGEILWRAGHASRANDIPKAQFQANVAEAMERAARGIHKAKSLAEQIGEASFIAVMDKLQIESMTTIPRLESLKTLVIELEEEAARSVA